MDLDHFTIAENMEKYQFWKWKIYVLIIKSRFFQWVA